ncbi:transketolase [Acidaminobacter sp. JC074]|uniref:transketolase n=1 Tax=Acidaminobacter sp. JC074 TaxID=2530199 RepID=UPI001F112691|nr:transketolase [Acidaminobacter sp. JC074]
MIKINNIRKNIVKMVHKAKSGHIGGALSAVELMYVLYFEKANINKENVASIDRDRVVFSKGHASALAYAILSEADLLDEDLETFRALDSKLQGHPNMNYIEGIDMSTGSLGQGFSVSVGMAMANKLSNNSHRVYVLIGDGELQEGQVWEAAMSAAHYKLNNLCALVDCNNLQIDGPIEIVMNSKPIDQKFKSFGWHVLEVDGHDLHAIRRAYDLAGKYTEGPTVILANTVKGKGVKFMENNPSWHGTAPNDQEYLKAMEVLEVNNG